MILQQKEKLSDNEKQMVLYFRFSTESGFINHQTNRSIVEHCSTLETRGRTPSTSETSHPNNFQGCNSDKARCARFWTCHSLPTLVQERRRLQELYAFQNDQRRTSCHERNSLCRKAGKDERGAVGGYNGLILF